MIDVYFFIEHWRNVRNYVMNKCSHDDDDRLYDDHYCG